MTLSGGTTGALDIMVASSFAEVRSAVWIGMVGFMMSAVWSMYQKKVEPGYIVMAWRMAGTRAHVSGELFSGYWSL
jgi:ABC-type antimicrobial peptide transport system permease subunit